LFNDDLVDYSREKGGEKARGFGALSRPGKLAKKVRKGLKAAEGIRGWMRWTETVMR
jgi:hypothetical protein